MGGGLLNLVATGELNTILNGNPKKTFFKTTYAKYRNFGLQRFRIPYVNKNKLSLFTDSEFRFTIPTNGDLLMDTFFSFNLPDIYSPIYTIPIPYNNGIPEPDLSGLYYCQPYEFKWIENLGVQFIKKVTYLIDGRPIQEYSGQYLYCKAQRDLSVEKRELFNEMIGNTIDLTDPANFSNNNGNYPSVSWGGLTRKEWPNGLEPSIRGRRLFVPLYIWETFSSHQSFPLLALYYSKLEVIIECRPISEIIQVRDLCYFEEWVSDISMVTHMPTDCSKMFKYYDPPFIRPDFNNKRYLISFFVSEPPEGTFCLGDISYNSFNKTTETVFEEINQKYYSIKDSEQLINDICLYSTYAFLSEEERIRIAGVPHQYLVKKVFEKIIPNVQGVRRENVNSKGLVVSWMWFFQRTDVVLRNEWSNYSNWPYNNVMPYPCVLSLDLSFTLIDLQSVNTPYITPRKGNLGNPTVSDLFNPCMQYITGPTHPGNAKEIMIEWGLYCNTLERESILPSGINNYLEKYLKNEGDSEDGIYCYNFNIEKNININPSGAMNMFKFTDVAFEFTTIDPYREMIPREYDNGERVNSMYDINENCTNNNLKFSEAWNNIDEYFNYKTPGGPIHIVSNDTYSNFDYNFNLHIMEERYNILEFSGGWARYLFPS